MLDKIYEVERLISAQENNLGILSNQNIYNLFQDEFNSSDMSRDDCQKLEQKFWNQEYHMELFHILIPICGVNREFDNVVNELKKKCEQQSIPCNQNQLIEYLCKAICLGYIEIGSVTHIEKVNIPEIEDSTIIERMYLVENLLSILYDNIIGLHDGMKIHIHMEPSQKENFENILKQKTIQMISQIREVQSKMNQVQVVQDLEEFKKTQIEDIKNASHLIQNGLSNMVEVVAAEKVERNIWDFYKRIMEIIGIFLAVFSIIGLNLFGKTDINVYSVLTLTISCLLGIVTMFFLIDMIVNKKTKPRHFVAVILMLAVALVVVLMVVGKKLLDGQ